MSINFTAEVTAGTHYLEDADGVKQVVAYDSKDLVSRLDLGPHRIMRQIEGYESQDGMGSTIMTGAECIQWLNEIHTLQGHFAKHYIEEVMRSYKGPERYVSVNIEWS